MPTRNGFTLIELSIVLVIIGVLLAGAVLGINPAIESSRVSTTNSKLDRIELALLTYVMQNGCLPCPAAGNLPTTNTNAGWSLSNVASGYYGPSLNAQPCASGSSVSGSGCATNGGGGAGNPIGVVPWNTLGLGEGDITDAWGDRISYVVTSSLTVTAGSSMTRTPPAGYPAGNLLVYDNSGSPTTAQSGNLQVPSTSNAAAYVLISHGRDHAFAFSARSGNTQDSALPYALDGAENINSPIVAPSYSSSCTTCQIFRQDKMNLNQTVTGASSSYFDDIVRYRTAPNIIIDCGVNACGNPSS